MRKFLAPIVIVLVSVCGFGVAPGTTHAHHFTCTAFAANAYQAYGRCNNGADNYRVMARTTTGKTCYGYRASNGAWSVADCYNTPIASVWIEAPHY